MDQPAHPRLSVLFVCSLARWRRPTAERIYRDDSRLEVRSAGVRTDANRHLSVTDLTWAEVIFVMDRDQKAWIKERFQDVNLPTIQVLDIPDSLVYMDPELQRLLREAIEPEIVALLEARGAD